MLTIWLLAAISALDSHVYIFDVVVLQQSHGHRQSNVIFDSILVEESGMRVLFLQTYGFNTVACAFQHTLHVSMFWRAAFQEHVAVVDRDVLVACNLPPPPRCYNDL